MRPGLVRATLALATGCLLLLLLAGEAMAHAALVAVQPADGAVVAEAPVAVTLDFSEPVSPLVARLIRPDGKTLLLQDIRSDGRRVRVALPGDLGQGTHILSWRVASEDGHPIGGAQLFSIGAATATGPVAPDYDATVRFGLWLARLVLAAAIVVGVGGVAFTMLLVPAMVLPAAADRAIAALLVAGLVAVPLAVGLQGLDALGQPLAGLLTLETWRVGLLGTAFGRTAMLAAAAFLLAGRARAEDGRMPRTALALLALLLASAAPAVSGHAATAPPTLATMPSVFLHVAAATFWIGALLPLAALLAGRAPEAGMVLRRFSSWILPVVAVLALSGLLLAVIQVQAPGALLASAYGRVLLAKLALLLLLFLLAALNRLRLTAPALAAEPVAGRRLVRSVGAELVLALLILGVVGLWRFTPPPRALAPVVAAQTVRLAKDGLTAEIALLPPLAGPVRLEVSGLALDGVPLAPAEITLELAKPAFGLGPFVRKGRLDASGRWSVEGIVLPMDGFWVVRLVVLVTDFRSVTATDLFEVGTRSAQPSP